MNMNEGTKVDSILETKASGCLDVSKDLSAPENKTIAELLYDENNIPKDQNT